ncbi:transcription initiation factor IIB family protein [Haloarchaeobius amylolyticus]|uniref:transcription initiation factor IIB family protein n=1 Tax=Haloarchaeobius amylolyticus TaxID=1198296 RepID=UPI00226FA2EB|nr:transcription initiation factor IIB family protein [Haloarchaeobius amylolyticus]
MPTKTPVSNESDRLSNKFGQCPACGSRRLRELVSSLEPICDDCGAVASDTIEHPTILENSDDEASMELSWSDYYTITNSTEQQVATAMGVLDTLADELNLDTNVRERAAAIYAEAAIENLTDGRPTELLIGSVIAVAARELQDPRPTGRIASAATVRAGSLGRLIRRLTRELARPSPVCRPNDYLPYLRQELSLDAQYEDAALELLESLDETTISGKCPVGFAGAALYLASDGLVTQRQIAQTAAITGETLRVRVRDIRSNEVKK